ncbi:MAG TPA: porin, partial [Saprospiraceae bacterium]|nr:porin [Saprospiraceae bacterium]
VIYPQPFGIQAEYNWGQSPSFDAATDSIRLHELHGGYVTASWRTHLGSKFTFMPFVRYQTYDGAKKHETDARMYAVQETEIGVEWQVNKNLELTLAYMISHRKYQDLNTDYDERGQLLRVQVQANY